MVPPVAYTDNQLLSPLVRGMCGQVIYPVQLGVNTTTVVAVRFSRVQANSIYTAIPAGIH